MNISTKNKKTLTILLLLSLIMPALSVLTAFPSPVRASGTGTVVSVSPSSVGPVAVNSFFDVFVRVDNVAGMAAYTGTLTYNTITLTATAADAEYATPSGAICAVGCEDISPESINDGLGTVGWEVALTGFAAGFTGSGGMVKITFRVDAKGTSDLTPTATLIDTGFNEIAHKTTGGTFFVNPPKTAPVAVLLPDGPLKINVKEKILFDGSGSHDTNPAPNTQPIIRYIFTVNGATAQADILTTFSFSTGTPGNYNVCLVVVNQSGMSSQPDCTMVTVNAIKNIPTASLLPDGPLKINVKDKVTFDGSGIDTSNPPQAIVRYIFSVAGTPIVQDSTLPTFSFSTGTPGTYNVCLVVVNESGLQSPPDCTSVTVNAVKRPPTAVLLPDGPLKINVKEKVLFDGSQSHDNSNPLQTITQYIFTLNGAAVPTSGPLFSFTTGSPGTYTVCLVVVNESGLSSLTDCTDVTVNTVKVAPTASITPTDAKVDFKLKVTFTGHGTDTSNPPQAIVRYIFQVVGTPIMQDGTSPTFSFTAPTPGDYSISLVVCNDSGLCSQPVTAHLRVNAIKNAPTAVLLPDGSLKINVKEKVMFDGSGSHDNSNPLQTITKYTFSVGPLVAQSGTNPQFSFTTGTPGVYTVCLVVVNTSGLSSAADCTTVTVNEVKRPPTAVLTPAGPIKIIGGEKVSFDGSGSTDNSNPVQPIVLYTFTVNGVTAQSGPSPTFSFSSAAGGAYTVCLVVTNQSGLDSSADCTDVTVNVQKLRPIAVLQCATPLGLGPCPTKVDVKTKITYDGSQSHDNNVPVQLIVRYTFSVAGTPIMQSGPNPQFSFSTGTPGVYTVCLVVTNESGLDSTPTCTDVVVNAVKNPPTAVLDCGVVPTVCFPKIDVKTSETFSGSRSSDNSNPVQNIVDYSFSVNGAKVQSGPNSLFNFSTNTPGFYTICLVVTNESGLRSAPDCLTIAVNAVKRSPTAVINAPDKADVKTKVVFDGSGSFDNSNPVQALTYSWTDSTGIVLATDPTLSQTYGTPGLYTVTLTVCNTSGMCDTTSHTIQINEVKRPPTAVLTPAGPVKIDFKGSVAFDGSLSFDNSNPLQPIVSYIFSVDGATAQSGPSPSFSFSPASPGVYNVCLVVENQSLLRSAQDCTQVTVNAVKNPPTAVILPNPAPKISVKEKIVFDGSHSFDNSNPLQTITKYTFSVGPLVAQSGTNPQFSFTTGTPGVYTVCLVVVNTSGLSSAADCTTVTVNEVKRPPTAAINGPAKVTSGDNVVYSGAGSHDNSNPVQTLTYTWFDKTTGAVLGTGVEQKITFGPPGTFDLSLTVCNTSGMCDTANLLITINERKLPVTADLVPPKGGAAYETEPVSFTIRIFTGHAPFTCTLNFGDGTPAFSGPCVDGQVVTHTYAASGPYTATLTVVDFNNTTATSTESIAVQPEPRFTGGKLSWKHHLSTITQTFTAKITNPSKYTVTVTVNINITKPDGSADTASGSFILASGATNNNAVVLYNTTMLGKYTFTATLTYQVDVNGDGVVDITGTGPNLKSGSFNRV